MADDARRSRPDLMDGYAPESFDMFEFLRRLEAHGRRFGGAGRPDREPARLGQKPRLGFALSDIADWDPGDDRRPARVNLVALGLLGPEGPMPLHLTRWVLDRMSQRWFSASGEQLTADTTFLDFANVLQHRMLALFYRAWADHHPAVQAERPEGGRHRAMLRAMAGIGLPRAGGESPLDDARIEAAASLAHQVEGPERLAGFLVGAFGVPVSVVEWVGAWTPVPDGLQSRLGAAHARLGDGATIGPRVFQRHTRVELRVGPLDLRTFTAFAPGGPRLPSLLRAVRETAGDAIDVDIRLVLREGEVPPARVGASRLGLTGWLPRPKGAGDAGDLVLRTATGFRPDERRRAA